MAGLRAPPRRARKATRQPRGRSAVRISKGTNRPAPRIKRRDLLRGVPSGAAAAVLRPPAPPNDVASIAGVPESELTPSVQRALDSLLCEVQALRESLERSQRRVAYLEALADRDALLPVLNRRAFVRELARMISFAERYTSAGALIYFDIDGMKGVNDSFGHGAGDAVLLRVADTLLANLRTSDIVGRLGGDEFGVILARASDAAAQRKAEALSEAISRQAIRWQGQEVRARVSFGICAFGGGENVEDAIFAADRAMYAQKKSA